MLTARLTGAADAAARLESLPAIVVAALAAKSASLARQLAASGGGELDVEGPSVAGDRVVTLIGAPTNKAAVVRTLGAGAAAHDVARLREREGAMVGAAADVLANATRELIGSPDVGRIGAELRAAAVAAARGQTGG
jgi:hypothetical protein